MTTSTFTTHLSHPHCATRLAEHQSRLSACYGAHSDYQPRAAISSGIKNDLIARQHCTCTYMYVRWILMLVLVSSGSVGFRKKKRTRLIRMTLRLSSISRPQKHDQTEKYNENISNFPQNFHFSKSNFFRPKKIKILGKVQNICHCKCWFDHVSVV